jgi:hypothetical protein
MEILALLAIILTQALGAHHRQASGEVDIIWITMSRIRELLSTPIFVELGQVVHVEWRVC